MKSVLFVCIHNSARSQMAEELLRQIAGDRFTVESAGLEPGTINPFAAEVLKEKGIDISKKSTRAVADLHKQGRRYTYVITVCDGASGERCPVFPGGKTMNWPFEDPSSLSGTHEERLAKTRRVRDQIEEHIREWLKKR